MSKMLVLTFIANSSHIYSAITDLQIIINSLHQMALRVGKENFNMIYASVYPMHMLFATLLEDIDFVLVM